MKTVPSLSQISLQMVTANFARAWNSRDAFLGLTTVPLKPGWLRVYAESPSNMLTVQLLVNNTKCFLWALLQHSKTQHLFVQTETSPWAPCCWMKSRSENGQMQPVIGKRSHSLSSSVRDTWLIPLEAQVPTCSRMGSPRAATAQPQPPGALTSLPCLCAWMAHWTPWNLQNGQPIMGLSRPALLAGAFYIYSLVSHDSGKTSDGFG